MLVAQSCPTLCDDVQYSPWNSPGKNTGMGCHALLQGIFPTQGSNPGLPHCRWILYLLSHQGSPYPPANAGDIRDTGLIPGLGRSPGEGHDNPLQYSCLENPMDRGAWRATVHWVTKSRTQLKQLSTHAHLTVQRVPSPWYLHTF